MEMVKDASSINNVIIKFTIERNKRDYRMVLHIPIPEGTHMYTTH
jgi:hypothetical protein